MKTALLAISIALSFHQALFAADYEGHCQALQCGQVARLNLNNKGTEKLLKLGLDTVTQNTDFKKEANQALDKEDFPHRFELGSERMPIKAEIDNVHFHALKFGESQVDVEENNINVCVPVSEMDLQLDAGLEIYGNRFDQKETHAYVDPDSPQKPEVCFKGELGADGQVKELFQITNEEPQDIGAETKRAMLEMDIPGAEEEELLFTYMTLYFMEDDLEFPLKFDGTSLSSWSDVGAILRDTSPENLKRFVDFEKVRTKLTKIKGSLPPLPAKDQKEGLVNLKGNLKVDLNLEDNGNQLPKRDIFEKALAVLDEEYPKESEENTGVWGLLESAGNKVSHFFSKSARAVAAAGEGVMDRLKYSTEDIIRSRFLPYLQESFNQQASSSAPVMTAISKTAEKHLLPLAKKKAHEAIAAFQQKAQFDKVMRTSVRRPVFNAQDLVDRESLNRQIESFDGAHLASLLGKTINMRETGFSNRTEESIEKSLEKIEQFNNSISSRSSDMNAADVMEESLIPFLEAMQYNLTNNTGGKVPSSLASKNLKLIHELRAKHALLTANFEKRNREMELELSTSWFSQISGGPEVTVASEELCAENVGALAESQVLSPSEIANYDVTASVNTDAINAVVRQSHRDGAFDFCLYGNEVKTCSTTQGNFENRCQFKKPPELVWNPETRKHQIKLKNLSCDSRLLNADKNCGQKDKKIHIPVLGFIANTFSKGVGGVCKFLVDQGDDFLTGTVGQNLIDVTVDVEPKVCGQSICLDPQLEDSKVMTDIKNVNPNIANLVGKAIGLVTSPVTDIVKNEIVDDSLMEFIENDVGSPLGLPLGIVPKKVVSESGRITVLSDIEPQGELGDFARDCLQQADSCHEDRYLRLNP